MLSISTESPVAQTNSVSAWHAVYTRHQHEKTVARILTVKGFETFLPLYQVHRRWQDRAKLLSLPLFPCYVFLRGDLERRLDIVTTPGMHAFVLSAGRPASISDVEIDGIRRGVRKRCLYGTASFCKERRLGAGEIWLVGGTPGNLGAKEESLSPGSLSGDVGKGGSRRS